MSIPHTNLTWIKNGEPVRGTDVPNVGDGVANRPAKELLENDINLDERQAVVEQYLSGQSGQDNPDYLVIPVGTDKFAPDL